MLIKSQNSRVTYITRLLALPLLLLVVAAFTLKPTRINESAIINGAKEEKTWTFVIDAGHGGTDDGVAINEGHKEKELSLAIALKIKELNKNPAFRIILTRESDIFMNVREKVDFTMQQKPDGFVSIHINGAPTNKPNGIEVVLGSKNTSFQKDNILLGSLINNELAKVYQTLDTLKKRNEKGVWVLDAPQINYPAALVECGYLTNPADRAFITDPKNQEKIAINILAALERFASLSATTTKPAANQENVNPNTKQNVFPEDTGEITLLSKTTFSISTDDLAEKQRMSDKMVVINGKRGNMGDLINKTVEADSGKIYTENNPSALKLYGEAARNGVYVFYNAKVWDTPKSAALKDTLPPNSNFEPLYVLDGVMISKEVSKDALDLLVKPDEIDKVDVLKGESAITLYGDKGKNGVVIITTKTGTKHDFSGAKVELTEIRVDDNSPVFTEVEVAPKFPNGEAAMIDYIKKQVVANAQFAENKNDYAGSCSIRFIVDKYGKLSNYAVVNSTATSNSKLASLVIEILQKGPVWNAALQNGNKVRAFHEIVYIN